MQTEQMTQAAGTAFLLAVMAWVIYRLTWLVVKLATKENETDGEPSTRESSDDALPEDR